MASSALKSAIILLMLTRIYDCTTYVDDFEIQVNNLRGGYGTDNKTLLRVVMLHLPPFFDVVRNSSNHIIKLGGVIVPVLLWLSRTMNLKFEIIPDNIYSVEDNAAGKGLMSYIVEGRAEILFGPIVATHSRFQKLNYPYPLVNSHFGLVIPMPSSEVDVNAVWKPFQGQIWIFLVASMTATMLCLYGISHFIAEFMKNSERRNNQAHLDKLFEDIGRAFQYVFGVILSQGLLAQGGTSRDQRLTIRVLAGTWCVACFVLVTAYSSVLISFVTSPNYKPLIRSVHDIPKNPQIKITVNQGWLPDRLFSNADEGIFKYLGDQLRKEPDLRCSVTEECLERVRKGFSAYVQEYRTVQSNIGLDLKKTGKCDFTIAKELFFSHAAGLAVAKNMDIEPYSRGLLKAHEAGFVAFWFKRDMVDASRCLNPMRDVASNKQRVTLAGLSGAFVALAFGLALSVLCFCGEFICMR
ncbi:ionotropic receptor 93a-like [Daphnia pulex]|uniref:ionotropic receptor 93a-like n=1 Tax=Daphnia pulex TaxID=6669 RepID=UPI001EDF18D0|nr:ionotropic receptor 93a-like [Daphnia pulex]